MGERAAFDRLVSRLYPHLRAVARRQLGGRRAGLPFATTGLVNEVYLRLAQNPGNRWTSADHFYGVAARAMRQVLVDYARERRALKRGCGRTPATFDEVDHAVRVEIDTVLDVDRVLRRLSQIDPRLVRTVECRYFAGLTEVETARALSIGERTVQRDWRRAKAWLRAELAGDG